MRHPFGQRDLLLVAARQGLGLSRQVALDAEAARETGRQATFRWPVARRERRGAREGRQHQVGDDRMGEMQALPLAVGRHIGEAEPVGGRDGPRQTRPASETGMVEAGRDRAIEAKKEILLALADQTADAEHLAGGEGEVDAAASDRP